ncbi:MAG TPA: fluoride efflux transporter FluC, partial [Candidatus Hypogeohydataceae bacterium YC38]
MQKAFFLTLWVGFGGFLGSIMRYWADFGMYSLLGERFPYGTLLVNIVGCYVIGFLGTLSAERALLNPSLRQFILIGIIG